MPFSPEQTAIIVRLGYDPTDLRAGLQQAAEDTAKYKNQAQLLAAELKRERVRLQTEYTAEYRRQTQQRIQELTHELNVTIGSMARATDAQKSALHERMTSLRSEFAAQQDILASYSAQIAKVNELKVAQADVAARAKESAVAAGLFATMQAQPGALLAAARGPGAVAPASVGSLAAMAAAREKELADASQQMSDALVSSIGATGGKAAPLAAGLAGAAVSPGLLARAEDFARAGLSVDAIAAKMREMGVSAEVSGQVATTAFNNIAAAAKRTGTAVREIPPHPIPPSAVQEVDVAAGRYGRLAQSMKASGQSAADTRSALINLGATQSEINQAMGAVYGEQVQTASAAERRLAVATAEATRAKQALAAATRAAAGATSDDTGAIDALTNAQRRATAAEAERADAERALGGTAAGGAGGRGGSGMRGRVMLTEGGLRSYFTGASPGMGMAGFAAVLGGTMAVHYAANISELVVKMDNLARATGTDVGALAELQVVLEKNGVHGDALQNSLLSLSSAMSKAAAGNKQMVENFRELGISTQDWAAKMPSALSVLMQMSSAMHDSADAAAATGNAQKILGFYGIRLIPILSQGRAAIMASMSAQSAWGDQIRNSVQASEEYQNALAQTKVTLQTGLLPLLDPLANAFKVIDIVALSAGRTIMEVFQGAAMGVENLITGAKGMGSVLDDIYHRNFSKIGTDWSSAMDKMQMRGDVFTADQQKKWADVEKQIAALGGTGMTPGAHIALPSPPAPTVTETAAQKAYEKALTKYTGMIAGLRTGPGGPYGTPSPDLVAAVNKKITQDLLSSGTPLPVWAFGMNGFTGKASSFGITPPSVSGAPAAFGVDWTALLGQQIGPAPVPGALPLSEFQQPFTQAKSRYTVGLLSAQQYIDTLKKIEAPLQAEIALRSHELHISQQRRAELQKMLALLKQINSVSSSAEASMPLGRMLGGFKDIADVVGKFSGGLSSTLSQGQASYGVIHSSLHALVSGTGAKSDIQAIGRGIAEAFSGSFKDIAATTETLGGFATGIASIVNGPGGAMGALSGGLTGAEMGASLGGPIGAAAGGVAGLIGGIFGSGKAKKRADRIARDLTNAANKITEALNLGAVNLQTAIAQLQTQLAAAQQISGKGTAATKNNLVNSLQGQINQLQAQQRQILLSFSQSLATLEVPAGAQSLAQQLEQVAKTLYDAAGAGASAQQQIEYLNAALSKMAVSLGDTVRSEENSTLSTMQQDISVRQQQQQLQASEQLQIESVKAQLGVGRAYTPAEQAALRIKQIQLQSNQQLKSLQDQQKLLDAQVNGEAQLYGLSMKDLSAADAKQKVLAVQLELQKQITAETVAQVQAQEAYLGQLLQGKIPNLPAGALPPNFSWPTGSGANYTLSPGAIVVNVSGSNMTPAQMADLLRQAMLQVTRQQTTGAQ